MKNTRGHPHRPITAAASTNWGESSELSHAWQPMTGRPMQGDYYRHDREHWQARRAFLTSYRLSSSSERKRFCVKEKMKRSVKELGEAAMAVVAEVGRVVSGRRLGIRVYRFSFGWSSSFRMVRCFVPWAFRDDHHQYLQP